MMFEVPYSQREPRKITGVPLRGLLAPDLIHYDVSVDETSLFQSISHPFILSSKISTGVKTLTLLLITSQDG